MWSGKILSASKVSMKWTKEMVMEYVITLDCVLTSKLCFLRERGFKQGYGINQLNGLTYF